MQKVLIFNHVAIVCIKWNYYKSDFLYMSKGEAINLLRNTDLIEVWRFWNQKTQISSSWKSNFVRKCRYWKNAGVLYSFFWRKECKYFIGYKDNDHKIKPSCIMPQKTSAHVKSYDGEKNWRIFLLKMMIYWKNIRVFVIKLVTLLIKNPSAIKNFWNLK